MEEKSHNTRNAGGKGQLHSQLQIFRIQMTPEEQRALACILPRGYIFQLDNRKKEKSHPKKKNPQELLLSMNQPPPKTKNTHAIPIQSHPQPKKGAQRQEVIVEAVKPCLKILEQLKQHKCAWPFLQPVDVEGLGIPEYREIVKQPMDLSTLESNLKSGMYMTAAQFHQDVQKIFHNSYLFNSTYEDFIKITHQFERYYYRISGQAKPAPQKQVVIKPPPAPSKQQKKKKKPPAGSREGADSQPMTSEEKRELAMLIHRLAKEHIKGVRNIVFDSNSEENEFDLEKLSQKKLKELQKFMRNKMAEMEHNLRATMMEKSEQQNLDELQSEITEEFIDQPLEKMDVE